jgi:hypothetical protein
MDCPSGPSTIHRVGTMRASPVLWIARRYQIRVMTMIEASRLRPNIAYQAISIVNCA